MGDFTPIEIEEWVLDTHAPATNTQGLETMGDSVLGRRVCRSTTTTSRSICIPEADYFYRDGEGDEVIFVHEGEGVVETIFGTLPYRKHDYVVIPRGTTYRFRFDGPQRWLTFYTPGEIETPNRYRNRYGQLLEHAPFSQRDFRPPSTLATHRERGEHLVKVRVRNGYQDYVLDYHPLDVVGWDGYVPVHVQHRRLRAQGRAPPPAAARAPELPGPNFVICSFCPHARLGPDGDRAALPPLQRAVGGDDRLRRRPVRLAQGRRHRAITLHPSGSPARPAAGPGRGSRSAPRGRRSSPSCATRSGR